MMNFGNIMAWLGFETHAFERPRRNEVKTYVPIIDVVQRGAAAEMLLKNAVLLEAHDDLESHIIRQWRASGGGEGENREWLWLKLRTVDEIVGILQGYAAQGMVEKDRREMAEIEKRQGKYS